MPVIEHDILGRLDSGALGELDHRRELLMPSYDGYGMVNLTPTVAHWLGAGQLPAPIFGNAILDQFQERYQNVVVILVDALGYNQFRRLMEEGRASLWKAQLEKGKLFPITSISPSTTASALTTLWTGSAPNQHGVIGYEMWHKELGLVMNNILHTPITYKGDVGGLSRAGFEPTRFMNQVTLVSVFHHGVESHAFLPVSIANSGLSQMPLWQYLARLLCGKRPLPEHAGSVQPSKRRRYLYAYWSDVDSLMHRYGTYNERVTEQVLISAMLIPAFSGRTGHFGQTKQPDLADSRSWLSGDIGQ